MNIIELRKFLENFGIPNEKIDLFLAKNRLVIKNGNIFLAKENLKPNQIYADTLLFIKLKKLLPSTYLLNFIKTHTTPINVKSPKSALNYTYGKDLGFDGINTTPLIIGKYYIIEHERNILGYSQFTKNKILNLMNIGDYLKEN